MNFVPRFNTIWNYGIATIEGESGLQKNEANGTTFQMWIAAEITLSESRQRAPLSLSQKNAI
jgi:hypothetical protein